MAYVTNWVCRVCRKSQHSAVPKNLTCYDCKKKDDDRKRKEHFMRLDAFTIEERIREIEEWIYEHRNSYHPKRTPRY